jgi:NADPH:quinone reductase-like Zn-dependent oxidoreductase
MKAMVYTNYGPPEVLRLAEFEKPSPREGEVLIKISATTVNRTDCGFRRPEYPLIIRLINGPLRPRIRVLGSELAGVVEETGKNVTQFTKGDRVFGLSVKKFGAHAEYICLPETAPIAAMPANRSVDERQQYVTA